MGRMKDLFMIIQEQFIQREEDYSSSITCPNCKSSKLVHVNADNMICTNCNYDYIVSDPGDEQTSINDKSREF